MRIVGCFLEYDKKFVILMRRSHKPDGNTWGLAGGKVERDETDNSAMLRELEEETGYKAIESELRLLGEYDFVSSTNQPYTFVAYNVQLRNPHQIKLEELAHAKYEWVTAEACYSKKDLIPGFHTLLRLIGYVQ